MTTLLRTKQAHRCVKIGAEEPEHPAQSLDLNPTELQPTAHLTTVSDLTIALVAE